MSYRIDHLALRTKNRHEAADFFIKVLDYKIGTEFDVPEVGAKCLVLEPNSKIDKNLPLTWPLMWQNGIQIDYNFPPEIFISDSDDPESIVSKWVEKHGVGLHHIAINVHNIEQVVEEWKKNNYAEFTTEEIIKCESNGLKQIFTKEQSSFGFIIELIEKKDQAFCESSIALLMRSTEGF